MDSFYDQPRLLPPVRRSYEDVSNKILPATVPDASMLIQNAGNIMPKKLEMSYNAWKMQRKQQEHEGLQMNKENSFLKPQQLSICKKQVRFESPKYNKQLGTINEVQTNVLQSNTGKINSNFSKSHQEPYNKIVTNKKLVPSQTESINKNFLQNKPFDKMYMANLPTTSLDLSIIEPKLQSTKAFNNYKEDFSKKENIREIFSNKRRENFNNYSYDQVPNNYIHYNKETSRGDCDIPDDSFKIQPLKHCNSPVAVQKESSENEPSVKDLLKIIQQQNEQLINLQKQVNTLMEDRLVTRKQIDNQPFNNPIVLKNKNIDKVLPKFSIDVMTSFEVSFRPQHEKKANLNHAKITEIVEKENDKDVSMVFNEPVLVREACPSPEHSIHVDMQDFSSDEEDDSNRSSLVGWTIYNNVMDQVNHLLKRPDDNCDFKDKVCSNTLRQVKEATLKHLKNVGVSLPSNDLELSDSTNVDSKAEYDASQISFVVKQLLMKYLPDDKLTRIASDKNNIEIPQNYPKNVINRRPEFSMATLQYMEKYNLLKKDTNVPTPKPSKKSRNCETKMLDITALKQQPKLL